MLSVSLPNSLAAKALLGLLLLSAVAPACAAALVNRDPAIARYDGGVADDGNTADPALRADASTSAAIDSEPLRIEAPQLATLSFDLSTGGLPIAPGLETYTVVRSDREHPELAEGLGWTFQHHPDIAAWHGRLYVGWNSCARDEDTWPSRELYSSSRDGKTWAKPQEMFPQGASTPLRMYFYNAANGRMLVIAGLRLNHEKTGERTKGPLVVRELGSDHSLGKVFTLQPPAEPAPNQPPAFSTSTDREFVQACKHLLADRLFLLQQDYGRLLPPPQRMKWNDPKLWDGDARLKKDAEDFGKAMCFFERKDGAIVGIGKKRWVTISHDGGRSWDQPVRPASFISNMGKVWGQKTSNGRYVLIYNPDLERRWPLAMLTSDDGITFRDPHALHGELPARQYDGKAKDSGASYHRGLNKWNSDGSWKDDALWMVYSLNKEEIRVMRVPVRKDAATR